MMKPKRPKVIKAKLEKELDRYSKRIQKLASRAYQIRQMLEDLAAMEQMEVNKNAVHPIRTEEGTRSWTANSDAGQFNVLDNIVAAAVLDQQPTELRDDSGNTGEPAGSGV